jgi:ubiquinone biosynthesis accessory factor UbiJ
MPFTPLPFIEDAANRLLRLDPETLKRLGDLHGRVVCIEFRDLGRKLYLQPSEAGFRMSAECVAAPGVTLRGDITTFMRLGLDPDRNGPAPGELEIQGDVALGQKMQAILQGIALDWEEPLARLFGDPVGHAIAQTLRSVHAWHVQALKTFGANAAEYLQHESRMVPVRIEVEGFLGAVDVLRNDVDRLAARIQRLAAKAGA